jgi:hypothetical protein
MLGKEKKGSHKSSSLHKFETTYYDKSNQELHKQLGLDSENNTYIVRSYDTASMCVYKWAICVQEAIEA